MRACGLRAAGVKLSTSAAAAAAAQTVGMLLCVCESGGMSVGACPTVTLLTHALQTMLFLQGLAAQRAGGAAGEGTRHQVMPVPGFVFGLLPLFSLLLSVSVLTLQGNKGDKQRWRKGFFFF